jgi:hypothetical protein
MPNLALKPEVTFCVQGVITPPCGVPLSLTMKLPPTVCAGAFSHLSIYISTPGQLVCLRTARISSVQSMLSKKP